MTFDDSNPPDWKEMRRISAEAERLQAAGELTDERYCELFARAENAANGHTQYLEGILLYAPPGTPCFDDSNTPD